MTTTEQLSAATALLVTLARIIRDAGAQGVPAGYLYADMVPAGITIDQYQSLERCLLRTGLIEKRHDCLHWLGDGAQAHADNLARHHHQGPETARP